MKFISWNVNGLRAVYTKGFSEIFKELDADFFCLQETKLSPGVFELEFEGYESFWNLADRKGYSGTAIYTRQKLLSVSKGLGVDELDHEGRVITLELEDFYLVTVYTPNSNSELSRLSFRLRWDAGFRRHIVDLDKKKPVVICGDFNVVQHPIDARNYEEIEGTACATDDERNAFKELLECGFVDTYRYLHPEKEKAYTWWSYRMRARQRNIGWRIDLFLISERLLPRLVESSILRDIKGSDHCPVELELK